MIPLNEKQAKRLDDFIKLIVSKGKLTPIDFKETKNIVESKSEHDEFVCAITSHFKDSVKVAKGGLSFHVSDIAPLSSFINSGGFTNLYLQTESQSIEERKDKQQSSILTQLQIEDIHRARKDSKCAKLLSWIAIVIALASLICEIVKK